MSLTKKVVRIILTGVLLAGASLSFASCDATAIKDIRNQALATYKAKDYPQAEQMLNQFYQKQCSFYEMSKESDDLFNQGLWLISDLMFYHHKMGNELDCLGLSDEVYTTWMVSDPSRHAVNVEKALQANKSQCEEALDALYVKPQTCPVFGHETMFAVPASWREQNEMFFEVACIGFEENSANLGVQRDGPKIQSEGMNNYPKLQLLYVANVKQDGVEVNGEEKWVREYQLDRMYFTDKDGSVWDNGYCYSFTPKIGLQAGMILFDGGSYPCGGGSAGFIDRVIVKLDYPLTAKIVQAQKSIVK